MVVDRSLHHDFQVLSVIGHPYRRPRRGCSDQPLVHIEPHAREPDPRLADRCLCRNAHLPPPFTCGSRSATAISPTTCPWMIRSTDSGSPRIVGAGYTPPAAPGRRGWVGINLELAAGDVHDPAHRDAAAAIRRGQPAFLGDVPPDDLDDQGDVLGPGW